MAPTLATSTSRRLKHRERALRRSPVLFLVGLAIAACTYDSDDRCDPGEVLFANTRCICAEGLVLGANGCVPCGDNEVAGANGCVCADGFTRASDDAACQPKAPGQGDACDAQTACTDPTFNYCLTTSGASGYCTTRGCASSADCSGGYACDTTASPAVCKRPPVGSGRACSSSADCAGTEATFCDAVVTHVCRVEGCSLSQNDCFEGQQCCDLSRFGVPAPICVDQGGCPG